MKRFDRTFEINQNKNCPYTPDHSYRILIIGGSLSAKANTLLILVGY